MRKFFKRFRKDERGNVILITAFVMPVLLGFVGLGTDTIQWTMWKRQLQRGADSSAIAGVYQRIQPSNTLDDVKAAVAKDLNVNTNAVGTYLATYPKITTPPDNPNGKQLVEVELAVQKSLSFSGMFLKDPPIIRAKATAAVVPGGDYCIVSLEATSKTGILGSGNGTLNLGCGMITNSTNLNAAIARGSSTMNVGAIAAVGGIAESSNWKDSIYLPFTLPLADPYEDVPATIPSGTPQQPSFNSKPNESITIQPGVYSKFDVQGDVTMQPGTYYLDNTNLDIGAKGNLHGDGVTIVLTNSSTSSTANIGGLQMNGNGVMNISAPQDGTYKGIALYQDRRAVDKLAEGDTLSSTSPNQLSGNAGTEITGVIYFPKQQITLNGNGTMEAACMLMVIKRIVFSGSGNTTNMKQNCSGSGAEPFKGRAIRLIS